MPKRGGAAKRRRWTARAWRVNRNQGRNSSGDRQRVPCGIRTHSSSRLPLRKCLSGAAVSNILVIAASFRLNLPRPNPKQLRQHLISILWQQTRVCRNPSRILPSGCLLNFSSIFGISLGSVSSLGIQESSPHPPLIPFFLLNPIPACHNIILGYPQMTAPS